jgi:hypothetical protein
VNILTGNDLKTGAVVWWDGQGWSLHVNEAVAVGDDTAAIIAHEQAARHVNGAYVIEAAATDEGIRPAHIKERIRALGPTVRLDLSLKPADPAAGNWVI